MSKASKAAKRKPIATTRSMVRRAASVPAPKSYTLEELYPPAPRPRNVPERAQLAMDWAGLGEWAGGDYAGWGAGFGLSDIGVRWLGYPVLSQLAQRPEYRMIFETRAKEMTRKWIKLTYADEEADEDEKLKEIGACMDRMNIRDLFRKAAEQDGAFGGAQIYVDTGASRKPDELSKPLLHTPQKLPQGSLKGFKVIEPIWTYPNIYNSSDPLDPDFYAPQEWYVQGKLIHRTRLLTMVSAEVPDIIKPAYSFRGVSMTQRAMPYVDNWLRTRQSVSDLVHSFSIVVLLTNMSAVIQGDESQWDSVLNRVDMQNVTRDNRGTYVLDKDTEDLKNLAVPLAGLHELQAQAQEQMASVAQIPLVKLLGITPSGLNASSDGEIRVFYDSILALQEHLFGDPLRDVIEIIQLHLFGEIDPQIGFKFIPLRQMDEAAEALIRKTDADTAAVYIEAGVIAPEETRTKLANDKNSGYEGLDPEDLPEPPMQADPDDSGDPAKGAEPRGEERSGV